MIDTIKLVLPFDERPEWFHEVEKTLKKNANTGGLTTTINPSRSYKAAGIYLPKLKFFEHPSREGMKRKLAIEVSLPKLFFGNNFSELADADFDPLTRKLSDVLRSTYSIYIPSEVLANAVVGKIDYSKNTVFEDYTPVSTIVNAMQTADISKVYDVQQDKFKNGGHIYRIHTNSLEVVMYDKVADLKQERISEKRSHEKQGYVQMDLLNTLLEKRSLSIARFEIRINSLRKIRAELKSVGVFGGITFHELYSSDISRKLLLKHWGNVFDRIPKAPAIADTVEHMLVSLKQSNPKMKFSEATRTVVLILLRKEMTNERYVRNAIDELFGKHTYSRYKLNGREPPSPTQLKTLLKITDNLTAMKPVSIENYC